MRKTPNPSPNSKQAKLELFLKTAATAAHTAKTTGHPKVVEDLTTRIRPVTQAWLEESPPAWLEGDEEEETQ